VNEKRGVFGFLNERGEAPMDQCDDTIGEPCPPFGERLEIRALDEIARALPLHQ
jgi:hypothetical protein